MKKAIFLMILLSRLLHASDKEDVESWFKETLKRRLSEAEKYDLTEIKVRNKEILAKSVPCKTSENIQEDHSIYIMMTFDLPESLWLEYSHILEKIGGSFIVRGLPSDSFIEFAKTVKKFRERGILAPIQLNPTLFEKFSIDLAPSIVLVDGKKFDKISGTVSLNYALEQFEKSGDTNNASILQTKLKEGIR